MQHDLFETSHLKTLNPNRRNALMDLQSIRLNIRLDHAIAGIIGLLILFVLIFSFGVEKGKKFAVAELQAEREKREQVMQEFRQKLIEIGTLQQQTQSRGAAFSSGDNSANPSLTEASSGSEPGDVENPEPVSHSSGTTAAETGPKGQGITQIATEVPHTELPTGKYTIQVVTYNSQAKIDEKLGKLRDKGYKAFVVPSGKFFLLCVNGFDSRVTATGLLKKLQSEKLAPQDSYVRLMPKAAA